MAYRGSAIKKRLKSPFRQTTLDPSLLHKLLYPKYTMLRNKKQWLPYGMPFKDLQKVEDYEESVARFARDYVLVTPDELISWGLISYENPKRKRGEPKNLSSTKKDMLLSYDERLQALLKRCVVGDSNQSAFIFTPNPTNSAYRIPSIDGVNDVFMTCMRRRRKYVRDADGKYIRHPTTKRIKVIETIVPETKLNLYMPVAQSFYRARGKPKREKEKIKRTYHYQGQKVEHEWWGKGRYTETIWYFADEIEPTPREIENGNRRWRANHPTLKAKPLTEWEVTAKQIEEGMGVDFPLRGVVNVAIGSWKARNKFLILTPLTLLNRINYGVVNHPDIIADIYPHNPVQRWDEDEN